MQVPKRKHSKSRVRKKRFEKMQTTAKKVVKTADGKAFKRPHIDEYVEL